MRYRIKIPEEVKLIFKEIENYGGTAYVVGGCVRDSILGKYPHDWDICSPVPAIELMQHFKYKGYKVIPTGLKHGTIAVILHNKKYEITTFRKDGGYSDGRHPDNVEWTSNLKEDLSRRDFTINAMAYNSEEGLIDPFGGLKDLENRLVKCVGTPDVRFQEDALRILRAIRFAIRLGFRIETNTQVSIHRNKNLLSNISVERITSELCLMLKSRKMIGRYFATFSDVVGVIIPEIKSMFHFDQKNPYHQYDAYIHSLHVLDNVKSNDMITKLAALFHDIGKPQSFQDGDDGIRHFYGHAKVSAEITNDLMKRMRFDNETRENVVELIKYHDSTLVSEKKNIKKWLNRIGEKQFKRLIDLQYADAYGHVLSSATEKVYKLAEVENIFREVLNEEECFSMKDLAINGNDIMKLLDIKQGKEVGIYLHTLLNLVIEGEINNTKNDLLKWIENHNYKSV